LTVQDLARNCEEDDEFDHEDAQRHKESKYFEYNCQVPVENKEAKDIMERSKFSDLIEDIDI
jgi:hypothetical protein